MAPPLRQSCRALQEAFRLRNSEFASRLGRGLALTSMMAAFCGCDRNKSAGAKRLCNENDNILLITLDTTRADRIGCYGHRAADTPTIDGIAARGVLFEQALAQVPQTLPSHATMLTGRYPRELGIRVNGQAALAEDVPTLATLLKSKGYATGAFVSSFVLDDRFGLARGFDVYEDEVKQNPMETWHLEAERPANESTDHALAWLKNTKSKPFFCWVHYYDPHDPYAPPPAFANRGQDAYDGEISFVDSEIRRIVQWLTAEKLLDRTLVVITGDHGESFGEHGERGHAIFLYQTNLHVPLIFAHPRVLPVARRVPGVVELADLFPTVVELFGLVPPAKLLGRSLVPSLNGSAQPARPSYGESHYAQYSYGWAEQRSLTTERWKFVSSTKPELFDLAADPKELINLAAKNADIAEQLRRALMERYSAMTPGRAAETKMNDAGRRALESLGYVSAGTASTSESFLTPNAADPKDMRGVGEQLEKAKHLIADLKYAEAIPFLEEAAKSSPNSLYVQYLLGRCYLNAKRAKDAIPALQAVLKLDAHYPPALISLGEALAETGHLEEGAEHLEASLAIDERNVRALALYAQVLRRLNRLEDAASACQRGLAMHPTYADLVNELGAIREKQGRLPEAVEQYHRAIELDSSLEVARFNAAVALCLMGRRDEAVAAMQEAVRRKPEFRTALLNRGTALAKQNQLADAERILDLATQIDVTAVEANYNLGVLAKNAGRVGDAVKHFEALLGTSPADERGISALSSIYVANKRIADMARILRAAHGADPQNLKFAFSLAQILASSSDDSVRDGREALRVAQVADQLSNHQDPEVLAVLAAALAENARFEEALATAEKALERAQALNRTSLTPQIEVQILNYKAGKPFRHPQL